MKKPPAPTGGQEQKTDFNVPGASSNGWPVASEFRTTWPWQDIDVSTTSALLRHGREGGWSADHCRRIADLHAHHFPLGCLLWEREARRARR